MGNPRPEEQQTEGGDPHSAVLRRNQLRILYAPIGLSTEHEREMVGKAAEHHGEYDQKQSHNEIVRLREGF